jgi:hypothetical protein
VLMGVDLGGRLLWTLPMIGYVFGVMAVDHGPDYRAANYWVPVLGSQAAALLKKSALVRRRQRPLNQPQRSPRHPRRRRNAPAPVRVDKLHGNHDQG